MQTIEGNVDISKLQQEKLTIEQEIIDIESRLNKAKSKARATGQYADGEWYNKKTHELSNKRLQLKKLNITINDLRQSEYKNNFVEDTGFRNKSDKKLNGFYLDPNIEKMIDDLSKNRGRGFKSWLANEAFKLYFGSKKHEVTHGEPQVICSTESLSKVGEPS